MSSNGVQGARVEGAQTNQQAMNNGTQASNNPSPQSKKNNNPNKYKGKGKSDQGNNNNNNSKYVAHKPNLALLGVKNDTLKTDNFSVFQCSIESHVLTNFDYSGEIVYLMQELQNPMPKLMKKMPTSKIEMD